MYYREGYYINANRKEWDRFAIVLSGVISLGTAEPR